MRMKSTEPQREETMASPTARLQPQPAAHSAETGGSALLALQRAYGNRFVQRWLNHAMVQRKCGCGSTGECAECGGSEPKSLQPSADGRSETSVVPPIVREVLTSPGQPLDPAARAFLEPRFGQNFSNVRVHIGAKADESARSVSALAYTVGRDMVFAEGRYAPGTQEGRRLLAHELTHTIQQGGVAAQEASGISQPGDVYEREADQVADQVMRMKEPTTTDTGDEERMQQEYGADSNLLPALQRQDENEQGEEEGFEVGDQLAMMLPKWHIVSLPADVAKQMGDGIRTSHAPSLLQRADSCDVPTSMRKVTSGKFEGGKTLDDYFPDLVGTGFWGSKDTAGTFDTGSRAGSAVQLIGEYLSPCAAGGSAYTLGQTATIVRARADGKKLMEKGKALEGQTLDDIARSGRDQSKSPFRQEFDFAVSMADPISGIPYAGLKSYEFEVNLTSSLSGPGGSKSVDWGVTVEASGGKVTKNDLR